MSPLPSFLTRFNEQEKSILAHAKRFKERYTADPAFRELVAVDAREAAKKYNINIDPEEIRPLWDPEWQSNPENRKQPLTPATRLCLECEEAITSWNNRHKNGATLTHPKFKAWWSRQIARANSEIGVPMNTKLVHAPACFELSAGCTVGCWFCAISAEKFAGAFEYNDENSKLWKETLEAVYAIAGPSAQSGFCYWATDPLDNPDYEKFISDYRDITGALPGTNTAKSHTDLPRVREILKMWHGDEGFTSNHLSVLTVKILDKIHKEFTAEELLWTGFNLVNKQSLVNKSTAGRARDKMIKLSRNSDEYKELSEEFSPGTIACVSGFLFNMVEKTVKLITPCEASDQWPKGYKILAEGTFTSGSDLKTLLDSIIEEHMPLNVQPSQIIKFRADLTCTLQPQGFNVISKHQTQKINSPLFGKELGELIQQGTHTAEEITAAIQQKKSAGNEAAKALNALFQAGMLEET